VNSAHTPRESTQKSFSLDKDDRWRLALRVAQSPDFQRARRLRDFFLYICEKSLTDRNNEIREQLIGVEVFRRPPDYNAAEDNIVRVEARDLRKRLDIYFLTDGRGEPVRIRIPKGSYVPSFEPNNCPAVSQFPSPTSSARDTDDTVSRIAAPVGADGIPKSSLDASSVNNSKEGTQALSPLLRSFFKPLGKIPLSTLFFAILAVALLGARIADRGSGRTTSMRSTATLQSSPSDRAGLWTMLFPGSHILEVVVADAGLPLIESTDDRVVQLADYLNGKYVKELEGPRLPPIMFYPYTSIADVLSTLEIAQTAGMQGKRIVVRYPADLQITDLTNDDMVFLGSSYSDPWIREFDPERNFALSVINGHEGRLCFSNKSPENGEPRLYCDGAENGSTHESFGLITFLPNLRNSGNILILEGTDMQGTEGAADFITHFDSRAEIQRYVTQVGRTRPPYFQLLLRIGVVGSAPGKWEVVAHRILSPTSR
jgi:hypothetical protein